MRSILFALGLSATTASAGEATPWSHGLSTLGPIEWSVDTAWHGAIGGDSLHFVDLGVGGPLHTSRNGLWSLGLRADFGVTALHVPAESRTYAETRGLRGLLQFSFFGPKRKSFHGIGFFGGAPFHTPEYFWLTPLESAAHGGLRYEGYVATEWVDVSIEAGLQLNELVYGGVLGALTLIVHPSPVFSFYVGTRAESFPTVWVASGVRFRAGDVELGASAHVPVLDLSYGYEMPRFVLHPSVEIRYTPGRSRSR